jgi:ATP-dependent protease HslVU (ClpYQ) peptidase subunit
VTAVCALEHGGKVWMGGDSAISTENFVGIQSEPKCFRVGPCIVGICGTARIEPLMKYLELPPVSGDPYRWVNLEFARAFAKAADGEGFTDKDWGAMVGVSGQLYVIESDLCGWRPADGYWAIGSGSVPAMADLRRSARERKLKPITRITQALECAAELTPYVRPPWSFIDG